MRRTVTQVSGWPSTLQPQSRRSPTRCSPSGPIIIDPKEPETLLFLFIQASWALLQCSREHPRIFAARFYTLPFYPSISTLIFYRVRYQSYIRLNMDSPLPFIAYLVSSDSRCIVSISHLISPSLCRMIDSLLSVCISYFHILGIASLVYTFVVLCLVPQSTSHI